MMTVPKSGPRRGGRPRLPDRGVSVQTWMRESEYDQLIRVAHQRRGSVSSLVRSLLLTSTVMRRGRP